MYSGNLSFSVVFRLETRILQHKTLNLKTIYSGLSHVHFLIFLAIFWTLSLLPSLQFLPGHTFCFLAIPSSCCCLYSRCIIF